MTQSYSNIRYQCECGRLWDASQCVTYALLSPTRYKTSPVLKC